jgi:hypothetical protein
MLMYLVGRVVAMELHFPNPDHNMKVTFKDRQPMSRDRCYSYPGFGYHKNAKEAEGEVCISLVLHKFRYTWHHNSPDLF